MASYQAYINSYQHLFNYFCNQKLKESCETANNINKFEGDFVDDLELYQSFKALYARVQNTNKVKIEDPNRLNNKKLNCDYNWSIYQGTYPQLNKRTYWQEVRLQPLPQSHLF